MKWVLVWIVMSPISDQGIATGSAEFATSPACHAAAGQLLREAKRFAVKAICLSKEVS